jgi:4-hydroxythreonine-4-phosphate dehydrogenase
VIIHHKGVDRSGRQNFLTKKSGKKEHMKKLAITSGDPAGIGPEICTAALQFYPLHPEVAYIVYGSLPGFTQGHHVSTITSAQDATAPGLYHIPIQDASITPGQPSQSSGAIALSILQQVSAELVSGALDGVVTCPVSKHYIRLSDPHFIGHTEFLADAANTETVVMAFWSRSLQVALLTTHAALCDVSAQLTEERILKQFQIITDFAASQKPVPRIALLAINPHAGEQGAFGTEEAMLMRAITSFAASSGIQIDGPFPADTFFASHATEYDMIISPYHDQGLIPFKSFAPQCGVNSTLGLPFVRTSVDHGTAFDIAGSGCAKESSLEVAIQCAEAQLQLSAHAAPAIYDHFANYYDHYMEHVEYQRWIDLVLGQFTKRLGKKPQHILELACGTANIAAQLVTQGYRVTASDNAPAMLKIAATKPNAPALQLADMTAPLPHETYDLIICLFDSINYLLQDTQISELLNATAGGLQKNGLFIFDISTLRNCEENFDGYVNLEDTAGEYLIHTSEFEPETNLQTSQLTFFRKSGYSWQRFDEVHQQRIYRVRELVEFIEKSPVKLLGIYGPDQQNLKRHIDMELDEIHGRLFFVCAKA